MPVAPSLTNNTRGILCLVGAVVFLTFSDAIIKWLSDTYPLHEITLVRALVALLVVLVIVRLEGGLSLLRTRRPLLHLFRGLLLVVANMFFFLGLSVMPLALVVALFFTAPLFICLLARPILGEVVGPARWIAIVVGLGGVAVMVQPWSASFTWSAVLPVLAALTYAAMIMVTRRLGMKDTAGTLAFYIQVAFLLVSVTSGLVMGNGRFDVFEQPTLGFLFRAWTWPSPGDLWLLTICGVIVAGGAYLLSQAYRLAQASVVAPFEYTSLPFAVLVGYFAWGDLPGLRDAVGSVLIVGSGLLVVYHESRARRLSVKRAPV